MTSTIRVTFYGDKLSRGIDHFSRLLKELRCIANKTYQFADLRQLRRHQNCQKHNNASVRAKGDIYNQVNANKL